MTRVGHDLVIEKQRGESRSRSSSESTGSEMSVSDTLSSVDMDSNGESSEDASEEREDDGESAGNRSRRPATSFVNFRNPASWCDTDMLTMIGIFRREFEELCEILEGLGYSSTRMALSHQVRVFLFKIRKLFQILCILDLGVESHFDIF